MFKALILLLTILIPSGCGGDGTNIEIENARDINIMINCDC